MGKSIIIIGGGVAGLSAGIYAKLNGFDAEIIEMHSVTGGQCTAWERRGYRFDYCLHWLVGTRKGPFNDIWKVTNVINDKVEIIDHEVHTKIFAKDGREFTLFTDLDRWEKYLLQLAPEDTRSIKRMCRDMRKSVLLEPYSDPPGFRKPFKTIISTISMIPVMMLFMRYGKKSCSQYFRSMKLRNPHLAYFLENMYGTRDFSALAFIMMFAWFNQKNAGYLIGGSKPLSERMTDRFKRLGGKLTTKQRVTKIIVENDTAKGVILSDGTEKRADYVISAADGHSTIFDMLEGKYVGKKIADAYNSWEVFTPLVQVSFGINKKLASENPVEMWLVQDQMIGRTKTETGYSIMNYWFDPTMAPDGKSVLVLRFESPWDLWSNLTDEEYNSEKKKIEADATALLAKHYPGILTDIEVTDVATPLTDVRYTGVWKGSYEGFMPGSKNLITNLNSTLPGLKKFYMAGQWLFPGGGLPPAGQSGKWAIQFICREEKLPFKSGSE
jgi:phytoene dehydrogenase-like protein